MERKDSSYRQPRMPGIRSKIALICGIHSTVLTGHSTLHAIHPTALARDGLLYRHLRGIAEKILQEPARVKKKATAPSPLIGTALSVLLLFT